MQLTYHIPLPMTEVKFYISAMQSENRQRTRAPRTLRIRMIDVVLHLTGCRCSNKRGWAADCSTCINLCVLPLKYFRFYLARKPYVSIKVLGNSFPFNFLYTISYTHKKESLYIYIWKHCASIENSFILLSRLPTPIRVFFFREKETLEKIFR